MKRYQPRPVRFQGVQQVGEWRLKAYGISAGEPVTRDSHPALFATAHSLAEAHLSQTVSPFLAAGTDWNQLPTYGVGCLIAHIGGDSMFVVLCTWAGVNMFRTQVWVSPKVGELAFEPLSPSGLTMCVWEQAVMGHEREAWLRHVYRESGEPDFEAYLNDGFAADF